MSAFKKLNKSDVTWVSYNANKQWNFSYSSTPTNDSYLTIFTGTNVTGSFSSVTDPTTSNGEYQRLIYDGINHMFYQNYSGSVLNTGSLMMSVDNYYSASQQRPTGSYFNYNENPLFISNFPTGSGEGIKVLAINQSIYGNKILPNYFQLSSSVYNIKDDGNGNLYDYSGSITFVGNIFYAHGLAVITNQDYL